MGGEYPEHDRPGEPGTGGQYPPTGRDAGGTGGEYPEHDGDRPGGMGGEYPERGADSQDDAGPAIRR